MRLSMKAADGADVGYILGHQDQYEELRYSLRSVEVNFPNHGRVFIAGAPPPSWARDVVHIPIDQRYVEPDNAKRTNEWWYNRKFNMRTNLLAICDDERVSDHFLYMNDDFYLVRPFAPDAPLPHRGTIREFSSGDITKENGPYPSIYTHLVERGVPDPVFVSEHVPIFVNKYSLAVLMRAAWHIHGFPYASLWGNLMDVPLRDDGKVHGDWLLVKEHLHTHSWPEHQWSVSTVHRSFFDWPVGEKLRGMFGEPSRYETT